MGEKLAKMNQGMAASILEMYEKQIVGFPLKKEALRIFRLADEDSDGRLDLSELNVVCGFDEEESKVLMKQMDLDASGKVDEKEWLKYIEKLAKMKQGMAASILELYEKQIADSAFPLKEEALRVFRAADKDSDGLLDL